MRLGAVSTSMVRFGCRARSSGRAGISRCDANSDGTAIRSRIELGGVLTRSTASARASTCGSISARKALPRLLSSTELCWRSNSGAPTNCSSDWMRRVSAGEERAKVSAAAFSEPSRATATNACIDPTGGSLRTAIDLLIVQCTI